LDDLRTKAEQEYRLHTRTAQAWITHMENWEGAQRIDEEGRFDGFFFTIEVGALPGFIPPQCPSWR